MSCVGRRWSVVCRGKRSMKQNGVSQASTTASYGAHLSGWGVGRTRAGAGGVKSVNQTDSSVDLPNLRMPRILSTSEPTTSRTRIRGIMRSYPGMYALSAKGRTPLHPRIPRKSLCKEDIRKWDVSNARRTVTTGTMWGALQCTQTYTVFRTNVSSIFTVNSKFPFSTQRTHAGERIIGRIQRERMGISQLKCPR